MCHLSSDYINKPTASDHIIQWNINCFSMSQESQILDSLLNTVSIKPKLPGFWPQIKKSSLSTSGKYDQISWDEGPLCNDAIRLDFFWFS